MKRIILASQSPRRRQLLAQAEIDFEVMVSDADETYPSTLNIKDVPAYIALNKALAVQRKLNDDESIIIAADTLVMLGEKVIGKPENRENAIEILQMLSGKTHEVTTGVVILKKEERIIFSDVTYVSFYPLTNAQIEHYVNEYKPYDKAGAYAIQEWIGVIGIQSISGDFYNVMGLPVSKVVQHLNTLM